MPKKWETSHSRPKFSSSSRIFERRGDPQMSEKERFRDFGRELERENPERDWWNLYTGQTQWTRAKFAKDRVIHQDKKGKAPVADAQRKVTAILMKRNKALNTIEPTVYVPKVDRPFRLCSACQSQPSCIKRGACLTQLRNR